MTKGARPLRIRVEPGSEVPADLDLTFSSAFRIGRDAACEVHVPSALVSRYHVEVWPEGTGWWLRDLGSTNGTLLNAEPVERLQLKDGDRLQLGAGAPAFSIFLETPVPLGGDEAPPADDGDRLGREELPPTSTPPPSTVRVGDPGPSTTDLGQAPGKQRAEEGELSLEEIEKKYFDPESDRPAGKRTEFIRVAYAKVQKREKRRAKVIIGAVGSLLLVAVAYGLFQRHEVQRIDRLALDMFQSMKAYEVQLVTLRQQAEQSGSPELLGRLAAIDSLRERALASYQGYVRERGLYRRLRSREEELVFQTARLFGESEFTISGDFVQAVLAEINNHWLSPSGRVRFRNAIERAAERGYTRGIVDGLRDQGLPPEFFYLALQESEFVTGAVGPATRWGIAKGMWQFIPATAARYGLDPGPLQGSRVRDPDDERQNFELATQAAARYLRDLHGILTQASGLLVMAAYNWGEHRVAPRLSDLPEPRDVFEAEFDDVPRDPSSRNYWTFLTEYGDRMPEETKTYVIRIFAAAVIGQEPERFGFDFGNPLSAYVN